MNRDLCFSAKRLTNDETFTQAMDLVSAALLKQLLTAKTPEDRESKFQEYDALRRTRDFLGKLAHEAERTAAEGD